MRPDALVNPCGAPMLVRKRTDRTDVAASWRISAVAIGSRRVKPEAVAPGALVLLPRK